MPLHHEALSNTLSMGFYQKETFAIGHTVLPFKTLAATAITWP